MKNLSTLKRRSEPLATLTNPAFTNHSAGQWPGIGVSYTFTPDLEVVDDAHSFRKPSSVIRCVQIPGALLHQVHSVFPHEPGGFSCVRLPVPGGDDIHDFVSELTGFHAAVAFL